MSHASKSSLSPSPVSSRPEQVSEEATDAASPDAPEDEFLTAEMLGQPPETDAEEDATTGSAARSGGGRRWMMPVILFAATCVSCFWVGVSHWDLAQPQDSIDVRRLIIANWDIGLIYVACTLSILLTHEMGHFLGTVRYRVPASLPYFIPMPLNPIGTLGAVIAMDGKQADRKELFDIGIAGPLAGLVVTVPILIYGVYRLDLSQPATQSFLIDVPWAARLLIYAMGVPNYEPGQFIGVNQLNPYFMAGWFGLFITGLNMFPVSQLDGGHVLYALFGRRAHALARGFMFAVIAFVVFWEVYVGWVMVLLVIFLGIDHPPTANDRRQLDPLRKLLGYASLAIPLLCLPPQGIRVPGM